MMSEVRKTAEAYRLAQRKRCEAERDLHLAQAAELQAWLDSNMQHYADNQDYIDHWHATTFPTPS